MKTFIAIEQLNKKLCIHCRHCIQIGLSDNPTYYCGKFDRSLVDDSVQLLAQFARGPSGKCGGREWSERDDINVVKDEQEFDSKRGI